MLIDFGDAIGGPPTLRASRQAARSSESLHPTTAGPVASHNAPAALVVAGRLAALPPCRCCMGSGRPDSLTPSRFTSPSLPPQGGRVFPPASVPSEAGDEAVIES